MKQRNSVRHKKLRAVLKEARIKAGLRQVDLCNRLKRDDNYVSDIERGMRMLDALEFIDYVQALGADPPRLLRKLI